MNATSGVGGVCDGTWMLIMDQSADCVAGGRGGGHFPSSEDSARNCER